MLYEVITGVEGQGHLVLVDVVTLGRGVVSAVVGEAHGGHGHVCTVGSAVRITSYNVCYTKLLRVAAFPALDIGSVLRLRAGEDLERLDPVDLPDDGEKALHLVEATVDAETRHLAGTDEIP